MTSTAQSHTAAHRIPWTRPLVVLNLLATFGLLLSVVFYLEGRTAAAYGIAVLTNAPAEVYLTLLTRHLP
jgi:hypothetical protein